MADTGRPASAPPEEISAAGEEQQPEYIEGEFVNDVVGPAMKFQCLRDARGDVITLHHRCAKKQDHESSEERDVRSTGQPAATHSGLAQCIDEQTAKARFELGGGLLAVGGHERPCGDTHALAPQTESPPNPV